jgi:glutathione S-transferase
VARYGVVEKMLAGKSYLLGETFTAADAYLFVVTRWSFPLKLDLSQYSNLAAFMARVGARPKVKEAIAAEA